MTEASNRSRQAKARWEDCGVIASKLAELMPHFAIDKHMVHNCLYGLIAANGWTESFKLGETRYLTQLIETPEWKRMVAPKPEAEVRIHDPEPEPTRRSSRDRGDDRDAKTPAARLRLAMWFIERVGGANEAIRVVKAAAVAMKALDEP